MRVEIQPIEDALHPGQTKVLEEAGRFNVLECGRRFGKTHLGIQLAIDRAIDGGEVGWFPRPTATSRTRGGTSRRSSLR